MACEIVQCLNVDIRQTLRKTLDQLARWVITVEQKNDDCRSHQSPKENPGGQSSVKTFHDNILNSSLSEKLVSPKSTTAAEKCSNPDVVSGGTQAITLGSKRPLEKPLMSMAEERVKSASGLDVKHSSHSMTRKSCETPNKIDHSVLSNWHRLLELTENLKTHSKFFGLRLEHCNGVNEWAAELAHLLCQLAENCLSTGSDGTVLVELSLSSNFMGSRTFAHICASINYMPGLLVLDLSNNQLSGNDLNLLGPLLNNGRNRIQRLILWGNGIGFDGAAVMAGYLSKNDCLFALDLGSNNIGDQGFLRLVLALQRNSNSRLRWLGSNNNNMTTASILELGKMLSAEDGLTKSEWKLRRTVFCLVGNQIPDVEKIRKLSLPLQKSASDRQWLRKNDKHSAGWPFADNVVL